MKGVPTKRGYIMSQYSKFIRPGYHRVESYAFPPTGSVHVTAYRDSTASKNIIVAVNTATTSTDLVMTIANGSANMFTPYTTSESKNVAQGNDVSVINNKLNLTLEASSITTFVSN